jgi:CubicO group peptidase (beta-lactamase class C family)
MERISRRRLLAGFAATAALGACTNVEPPVGYTRRIARPPAPPRPRAYPALQALIDRYVGESKVAGIVVAVKKDEAPLQFLNAGKLALDANAACGPDSLYRVYSMSKPVAAIAAMQLVERGKLSLDQPIADFIPEFAQMRVVNNADTLESHPARTMITPRHLMTHTSGLVYHFTGDKPINEEYRRLGIMPVGRTRRDFDPNDPRLAALGAMAPQPSDRPLPDTLDAFGARVPQAPLESEPATRWSYSIGLDVLGVVIQRASGMPFERYLAENLFAPLRMGDTAFYAPSDKLDRLTSNYAVASDGSLLVIDDRADASFATPSGMPCGGAGLVSSANDYARFAHMLLNGGALDGARVLARETVDQACSNLMPAGVFLEGRAGARQGFGAGMSVVLPDFASPTGPAGTVSWGGAAGTIFWVDRASNALVVLMTQYMGGRYPLREELAQAAYQDFAA